MNKIFLLSSICFLLLSFDFVSSTGQIDTTKIIHNPEEFVAKQLFKKKIVMLGDFGHSESVSVQTCIAVLRKWIEEANKIKVKCHLTLILEFSAEDAEKLNEYFRTGDIETLLKMMASLGHIEDIEFFTDLRELMQKVIQSDPYKKNLISLNVKGFEQIGHNPPLEFKYKTPYERERWFIDERDSMTSMGIFKYLNENPDESLLLFYGSAHLIKNYTKKEGGTNFIKGDSTYGYYVAHYLKEKYGSENVLTITQTYNPVKYLKDSASIPTMNYNFYSESKYVPWKMTNPQDYDAFIFRKEYLYFFPHEINFLLCKAQAYRYLTNMKEKEHSDKIGKTVPWASMFSQYYFGTTIDNSIEFKTWLEANQNRINLNWIDSVETGQRFFSLYFKDPQNYSIKRLLNKIGFLLTRLFPDPDTAEWKNELWPEMKEHVKFINAVGIYWLGYPDEQSQAKEFLKLFSGQDFQTAKDYFSWYRKKYYDYDF